MREEPLFRKCCRCVPLRVFLQIWAWIRLAVDIAISVYLVVGLALYRVFHGQPDYSFQFTRVIMATMMLIACVVDFIFVVILIAGVCRKNYITLRVFFYYGIYVIIAEAAVMSAYVISAICQHLPQTWDVALFYIFFMLVGLFWISIDILIILTLKSEMIKIRNKEQYDFSRMTSNIKSEENNTEKIIFEEEDNEKFEDKEEKCLKLLD